ncbi:prepilin peptidase [Vibrio sp. LaRot3]|uniref:prepilin peptidase n=1 Tax=Vibrio sp. LaRot3 TaxID=2998829 RepID=UPI003FCE578D
MIFLIGFLFVLSISVCYFDWRYRIIPNWLCLLILLLSIYSIVVTKSSFEWFNFVILVPVSLLVWKVGIWGAGDSKLLLAFFPMIDSQYYLSTMIYIGFAGFVTVIAFLISKKFSDKNKFNSVPYGIPIALSCFITSVASI